MKYRALWIFALCAALTLPAAAELSEAWQRMNQPVEPFRILGNLYYVGASSVTSFLITTPEGHILIDGGFEETVPLIRNSIAKLGFRVEDIEIVLNSHAHTDHAGGIATIKELSGARFMASVQDAPLLERGGMGDDLLGDIAPYKAAKVDRQLEDGDVVALGGTRFTAHVTAGHTRGCTSWAFEVSEGDDDYLAVSICSLSVLDGMQFGGAADGAETYPGIARDFEKSFETLEALPADIFLASHAEFFRMKSKRQKLDDGETKVFVDREGYLAYITKARQRFEKALAEEKAADEKAGGEAAGL